MIYEFPAIISYDNNDGVYYVNFPDIQGCYTDGKNLREAIDNADDALNLMLLHLETQGKIIPTPQNLNEINLKCGQIVTLVKADTETYSKILSEDSKVAV